MRKILLLLIVLFVCTLFFSACNPKEIVPFEYTSEILIDTEIPCASLVLAGRIGTPTIGLYRRGAGGCLYDPYVFAQY